MITDKLKANAIALLKLGDSVRQVSEELEIPYMLVKEWADALDVRDLTALQANTRALATVMNKQAIIEPSEQNKEILKAKIEKVALDIVDHVELIVHIGDPIQSKALQLLADTCSKLYLNIANGGDATATQSPTSTIFEQLSRD